MAPNRWLTAVAVVVLAAGTAVAQPTPTIPLAPPSSDPVSTGSVGAPGFPSPTVPGPTVPTSTVPGPTVPGSTVPGPTVPTSSVPGPTVPGSTVPGPTVPTSTVPTVTVVPARAVLPGDGCAAFRPSEPDVHPRALFPGCRLVAYYGNFRAAALGVLGQGTRDSMLRRLRDEIVAWQAADPASGTICGFELIVTVAQARPGADGLYRARMDDAFIGDALSLARQANCLLVLDVQVGRSTVAAELPRLVRWLREPDVHLALDPEWAMGPGQVPGRTIGSLDARDVNFASALLDSIVVDGGLPPKLLAVHRFTAGMLTRPELLRTDPGVQLVINMDGFGPPARKRSSYRTAQLGVTAPRMGIKLFYRNDDPRMPPADVLALEPRPVFVNYQ